MRLSRAAALALIPALAFADQVSKWYVIEKFFRPRSFDAHEAERGFLTWLAQLPQQQFPFFSHPVTPYFNLVMVWNKGVSFGMFANSHAYMPYALMLMALAMSGFFLVWLLRAPGFFPMAALAAIISGALSNAWDRVRFGAVADFLDFHLGDRHWPAFNIADSCIVIGVAGLALHTLFFERKRKNGDAVPAAESP
jgi:signal peptidase II